ncbi:MAG: efflux RND transporter periplasmic adaptor subunit, partial [Caldilineaceae bacterium]
GGWYYYQNVYLPQQAAAAEPAYETVTVARGPIAATVNATGSIEPESTVSLQFRTPGRVANVLVSEGQAVQAGQLLAELETTDLALAVAQAQVNLQIAEAQLTKLETPPDEDDILAAQAAVEVAQSSVAGAEASLNAARANYNELFSETSDAQRQVNEANVRQAEVNLRQAQSAYDRVKDEANIGELPQSAQLQSATLAYEVALAQTTLTEDTDPNSAQVAGALNQIAQSELGVRQAQANLIQAQNNLTTLLEGPSAEDLEIARAQVQQARISQLSSENSLANAQLVAPIDGVVSLVNVRQGELFSGGLPAITMANLDEFHMDVLVDEIDVRQVAVGQEVAIRVDAFGEEQLRGQVTEIAPTADNVGGVIAYQVTIVPDDTELPLRSGMSATAIITTADVPSAVLVPNRFINLNRESGEAFVYRMVAGAPALQEVELGLRNERESQVVAGLNDGDELALVTASGADQLRNAFFGGN